MAPISFRDIFLRLPPATTALILAAVFGSSDGHALPRQTKTVEFHELNVVAWPPLPTEPPISPFELQRRQEENTVCGYIGGDPDLPATCLAGSHCVLDTDNRAIGCCPNSGSCTAGVFTGCVDGNSGPQTEVNPYVYTCQGTNICYKNEFAGGYSQYGCGTASEMGTTVQTSYDGATKELDLEESSIALTQTPVSLSEPTTVGTPSQKPSTASPSSPSSQSSSSTSSTSKTSSLTITSSSTTTSSSSASSSSTITSSSRTTSSTTPSTSSAPTRSPSNSAAPAPEQQSSQTGAIVGGTVGGAAALMAVVGVMAFCLRKRNANDRQGPGPTPTAPPTTAYMSPIRSHGATFAPLQDWRDDDFHSTPYNQAYGGYGQERSDYGNLPPAAPPPARYNPVHVQGVGTGLTPVAEEHDSEQPSRREIDDFSRAYMDARIGQAGDDDRQPLTQDSSEDESIVAGMSHRPSRGGSHRPLWQQNRQQSRNLMWL